MPRRVLIALILLVIAAIAIGGHWYIFRRLVIDTGIGQPWRALMLVTLVLLGASWFAQPLMAERLPAQRQRAIAWTAAIWMGVAWFLGVGLLITDALWWLVGTQSVAATATVDIAGNARERALLVTSFAAILGAIGLISVLRPPRLRRVEIALARWPRQLDGFRIVQISDIHFGPLLDHRFAADLVRRCNALTPDLIAITGDLVDGPVRHVGADVAPLGALRARHGVFFITGNHDYFSNADAWVAFVRDLNMTVLRNQHVRIDAEGVGFDLAGVDDDNGARVTGDVGCDIPAALAGRDPERPVVLLAHDPLTFPTAARHGIDLQLSGHTHGGQIWPFMYFVRLVTPYVAGLHRRGSAQIYVSRGTGFWGPCMRLGAPAEITELVLRAAA